MQLKSTPVLQLHHVLHRCFPCISDVVDPNGQFSANTAIWPSAPPRSLWLRLIVPDSVALRGRGWSPPPYWKRL